MFTIFDVYYLLSTLKKKKNTVENYDELYLLPVKNIPLICYIDNIYIIKTVFL